MSTSASRHCLYVGVSSAHGIGSRLNALGSEAAATMMKHLPPVGWADVATRHDVDALRIATKSDLEHLEMSMRFELERGLRNQLQFLVGLQVTSVIATVGAIGALVALT